MARSFPATGCASRPWGRCRRMRSARHDRSRRETGPRREPGRSNVPGTGVHRVGLRRGRPGTGTLPGPGHARRGGHQVRHARTTRGAADSRMAETASGMLNSIGLQGPGIEAFLAGDLPWLAERGIAAVVSIAGHSAQEYGEPARRLRGAPGLAMLEVNISCPNVESRGQVFACSAAGAADVMAAVRREIDVPVFAKLSPDVTDIVD